MHTLLDDWFEAVRFACEAQSVISMRLTRLTNGDGSEEVGTMLTEKIEALIEAQVAALDALEHGQGLLVAAERAYAPFCRRVHANSLRLLMRPR